MHDTVQAVLRDPAFQRSVRTSLADRMLIWLLDWLDRLGKAMHNLPSGRTIGLGAVALLVVFLLARLVIVARQDKTPLRDASRRRRAVATDDPWEAADLLVADGRFEDAAHALYRGVVLALGRDERLRLDPSRTSGDYARELHRRGSSSLAPFRAFTRRFDAAVYGRTVPTAAVLAELRELSLPFRRRAAAA